METMTELSLATYQVTLPVFEGPLDLLLHLIEREELDITEVSLAQVTNQYVAYLAQISERDPDNLADFLVVAAKLLLIKSRVLLPQPPSSSTSEEEEDGDDLVRRLIEYKRFKDAARTLAEIEAQGLYSYIRLAPTPRLERSVDLEDVTLDDLLAAVRQVLAVKPSAPSVNGTVTPITITITEQMALIERETADGRSVSLLGLVQGASSRLEIIVTLLALLEMVKQLRVVMHQEGAFGDISIKRHEGSQRPVVATDPIGALR
jgi:segregation and condensation protein A